MIKNVLSFIFLVLCVIGIFWYTLQKTKRPIPVEPTYKVAEKTAPTVIPDGEDWGEDPKMK